MTKYRIKEEKVFFDGKLRKTEYYIQKSLFGFIWIRYSNGFSWESYKTLSEAQKRLKELIIFSTKKVVTQVIE